MNDLIFVIKSLSSKGDKKAIYWFYTVLGFSLLSAVLLSGLPLILFQITSLLSKEKLSSDFNHIYILAFSYIAILASQKMINFVSLYLQSAIRIESIKTLSQIYFKSLYNSYMSYNENTGDITQKLNHASNDLYTLIKNLAFSVLSPFLQIGFSLAIIIKSGDKYVAFMIICYTVAFVVISQLFNKNLMIYRKNLMVAGLKTYSRLTDCVKNMPAVRACNSFDFFFKNFKKTLSDDADVQYQYWRHNFLYLLTSSFANMLFFGAAFIYTVYSVNVENESLAHFVMISSYIIVLSSPLENLSEMLTGIRQSTQTLFSFIQMIDLNEEAKKDDLLSLNENAIRTRNLNYSYSDDSMLVLENISLDINPGEFFTITGESGSGKTTLAMLISGQLRSKNGSIYIDTHDINDLTQSQCRDALYFVTQKEKVFMDSIRFNLQIANPTASEKELLRAMSLANFPEASSEEDRNTLNTVLGDDGMTLSGGQRQRLSLARLFLRNPQIIILDEVSSSLDVVNEYQLIKNIRKEFPYSTIINISHRASTLQHADRACVISSGKLVDIGKVEDLKARSPYFSRMFFEEPVKRD